MNPFSQAFCEILEEKLPEIKKIPEKISEIKAFKSNSKEKELSLKKYVYNQDKIVKNSALSLDVFFDGFEEIADSIEKCHFPIEKVENGGVAKHGEKEKPVDEEIISDISNFSFPKPAETLNYLNQSFIKENAINNTKTIMEEINEENEKYEKYEEKYEKNEEKHDKFE